MFLRRIRQQLAFRLWQQYQTQCDQAHILNAALNTQASDTLILDHYAILDLPGPHTGIHALQTLFELLGYCVQGRGYLIGKQNDFLWLAESDCELQPAKEVLPQIVLADFRIEALPNSVREIINHYANFAPPIPLDFIKTLITKAERGSSMAEQTLLDTLYAYLQHRDWPLPTLADFETVYLFNELLAWVLAFGRRINHFAISVHHLEKFDTLSSFNHYINSELKIPLYDEGIIKGSPEVQLEQSATCPPTIPVPLADGVVHISDCFVEFIWRHSKKAKIPTVWQDYFTGFLEDNANRIIETIYAY